MFFVKVIKSSSHRPSYILNVCSLNRAKDYYKNDKERLKDNARDKYRNLSEEEKNKKREYGRKK